MSKVHTPITVLSAGLAITVLLAIEDQAGLRTLPNDAAVIDIVEDTRSHLTFPRNGYATWAANELLLNNVDQFVLREDEEDARLPFDYVTTWENDVQVNLVVDENGDEIARAGSEDLAIKIAAALRAADKKDGIHLDEKDGNRLVPMEQQSSISQKVLNVIYLECQRGASPEHFHSAIMSLLREQLSLDVEAAPSALAAPYRVVVKTDSPGKLDAVQVWKGERRIADINGRAFRSTTDEREMADNIVKAMNLFASKPAVAPRQTAAYVLGDDATAKLSLPTSRLDTDESRQYLVRFMNEHFSDRTFHSYILGRDAHVALAGDFAYQMANALVRLDSKQPMLKRPSAEDNIKPA